MSALIAAAVACVSLSGARITAGDLAKAIPGFAPADPATVVAWAPLPGVVRVFHGPELGRILPPLDPSASVPPEDICFERPVAPLDETAALKAMHAALGPEAKIEVVEWSRLPAPAGEIVFPREGLNPAPVALWQGFVRYDETRKFPVWARVRVRVSVTRMIALEALPAGKPIQASQVKLETLDDVPNVHVTPMVLENVERYIPRRTIAANSPVWADSIDPPFEIVKGDRVTVKVYSGLAALTFDVEAAVSGRRGDFISLKNPGSGKVFRARVDGPKAASIQTDPVKQ